MLWGGRCGVVQQAGDAEVQELYLALSGDHHIAGFQVTVDDQLRVGGGERFCHLQHQRDALMD